MKNSTDLFSWSYQGYWFWSSGQLGYQNLLQRPFSSAQEIIIGIFVKIQRYALNFQNKHKC